MSPREWRWSPVLVLCEGPDMRERGDICVGVGPPGWDAL